MAESMGGSMGKWAKKAALFAGLVLLPGTMAASCAGHAAEDVSHDSGPLAASLNFGRETLHLSESDLQAAEGDAGLSGGLRGLVNGTSAASVWQAIGNATDGLSADDAKNVIENACKLVQLPAASPATVLAPQGATEKVREELQNAMNGSRDAQFAAYVVCQGTELGNS